MCRSLSAVDCFTCWGNQGTEFGLWPPRSTRRRKARGVPSASLERPLVAAQLALEGPGGREREEVKGRPACQPTITFQSDCGPRLNMRWKSLALKNGYFYIPFPKFHGAEIQFKTKRNPKRDRGKKYPTMKIILSFNISNAYFGAPPRPTEPTAGLEPRIFNLHPADSCIPLLLIVGTVPATRPGAEDAGCSDTGKFPALWRRFSQKATTQHPSSQWGLGRASESSSWEGLGLLLHHQKQHFLQASEEEGRGSGLQVWVARGP